MVQNSKQWQSVINKIKNRGEQDIINKEFKNLKKVEKKIEQVYDYLDDCQTLACNERLRININRICMIDEIVSELIIELECMEGDFNNGR